MATRADGGAGEPAIEPYRAEDDLVAAVRGDGRPRVRVYRPAGPMVVLGRGSRAEAELDLAACRALALPLYRRPGGGGAVVLDPGCLAVAAVAGGAGFGENRRHLRAFAGWLIEGLAGLGIADLEAAGISDIARAGRKVAGTCLHRPPGLLHFSASLLVVPPLDLMERCLRPPPRAPEYRRGRAHADFVAGLLADPGPGDPARIEAALAACLDPSALAERLA